MSHYRRARTFGGSYFFTVVTYRRQPLLIHPESRQILREVIQRVQQQYPFVVDAWVLLPDHTHCVWTLPSGDSDYSKRWSLIKSGFSKRAGELFKREDWINKSKVKHRESTIWQRRFWEHSIRNQEDFNRHIDVFIGIQWNTDMLPVLPIGNIRHSTVMSKQGYTPNHGAVVIYRRLNQRILENNPRVFIVGWASVFLRASPIIRIMRILRVPRGQTIKLFAHPTWLLDVSIQ